MALAADNNSSSETLFVSSGILSCVSMGTVAFTDLPKKWKKRIKLFDFITSIYSSDLKKDPAYKRDSSSPFMSRN